MKHLKDVIIFQATEQTVEDAIIGLIQGYETAKGYFMNRPNEYPDLEKTFKLLQSILLFVPHSYIRSY